MTQNDTSTPCEVCNGTGLAILPVRYTVVPASCPGAGLGPFPKGRGIKEDVSAAGSATTTPCAPCARACCICSTNSPAHTV
ncbi:hypothetical protein, partial [Xanthomonas oryzae]